MIGDRLSDRNPNLTIATAQIIKARLIFAVYCRTSRAKYTLNLFARRKKDINCPLINQSSNQSSGFSAALNRCFFLGLGLGEGTSSNCL